MAAAAAHRRKHEMRGPCTLQCCDAMRTSMYERYTCKMDHMQVIFSSSHSIVSFDGCCLLSHATSVPSFLAFVLNLDLRKARFRHLTIITTSAVQPLQISLLPINSFYLSPAPFPSTLAIRLRSLPSPTAWLPPEQRTETGRHQQTTPRRCRSNAHTPTASDASLLRRR